MQKGLHSVSYGARYSPCTSESDSVRFTETGQLSAKYAGERLGLFDRLSLLEHFWLLGSHASLHSPGKSERFPSPSRSVSYRPYQRKPWDIGSGNSRVAVLAGFLAFFVTFAFFALMESSRCRTGMPVPLSRTYFQRGPCIGVVTTRFLVFPIVLGRLNTFRFFIFMAASSRDARSAPNALIFRIAGAAPGVCGLGHRRR